MRDKILKNRNLIDILIILLVACFLGIPLFNSTLNVYVDDGIQHIARAYGTMLSLKDSVLFPNVISGFSNGFGYSWNLFYGPLSTYSIIVLNFIFSNFIVAYKALIFISLVLSGFFMYKFISNFTSDNNVGLLAGILYMSFPYHLTDMYIRNALGEYLSFVFIPLVFLGIYNLIYTSSNNYHIALGGIGLILTHNLSTIIVLFFACLYLGINIEKLKNPNIKKALIINVIFILLVTSFYWLPLLETKYTTDYQVYEDGMMATKESTASRGLKITQLFVSRADGSFVFEIGPHIIIMLGFSVMAIRLIREDLKETYVFCLFSGILSLWMATKYFPWKLLPDEISIIQFPWRMLMMSAFFLSVVCALNVYILIKKFNIKDVLIISGIAVFYTIAFTGYLSYDENLTQINDLTLGRMSGKEIETVAGTAKGEYLPKKAYENRFFIATRENNIKVLEGNAEIKNEVKDGSHYEARIAAGDEEYTILELPYIYYPGYEVRLDGMIVKTFETEHGFIGIVIGKDFEADLEVNYVGTKIMKMSLLVSFISGIVLCIYIWKKH